MRLDEGPAETGPVGSDESHKMKRKKARIPLAHREQHRPLTIAIFLAAFLLFVMLYEATDFITEGSQSMVLPDTHSDSSI